MIRVLPVLFLLTALLPNTRVTMAQSSSLPRATPESQGVDSAQLVEFVKQLDSKVDQIHSVMVVRNGKVILEAWWNPESADKPHVLWSLSKSFTSVAVGLAIEEEKLSLDDPVLSFFPAEAPQNPDANLKSMRVRDLLRMATGHQTEPPRGDQESWATTFLKHPVPFKPGTHFQYNTSATYMASAIVQKATGQKVVDYLGPRLFEPLGIDPPRWDDSPAGESIGGYGLYLKTEDLAKFGQLLLQKGRWNGQQLIPAAWIRQATRLQTSNGSNPNSDWDQGYGYQFWRCRHRAFRGDGKDGQFCVVLPQKKTVVIMTAKTGDLQGQLNVVWDSLLPGLGNSDLAENPAGVEQLKKLTAHLSAAPAASR